MAGGEKIGNSGFRNFPLLCVRPGFTRACNSTGNECVLIKSLVFFLFLPDYNIMLLPATMYNFPRIIMILLLCLCVFDIFIFWQKKSETLIQKKFKTI